MKDLKELFDLAEGGTLTYEQFMDLAKKNNAKFVDLSEGGYVSVNKHNAELEAKAKEIETLSGTISTRDADLETLKQQLAAAGADTAKLNEVTSQFQALQSKYDADSKAYKKQLQDQAYKYAVESYANRQTFSSAAAKRDFIRQMTEKQLKMENDSILGADDFKNAYSAANQDAFMEEVDLSQYTDPEPESKPQFVGSTPGADMQQSQDPTGGFLGAMHFTPVRPIPQN